jgi:hypothetical protein
MPPLLVKVAIGCDENAYLAGPRRACAVFKVSRFLRQRAPTMRQNYLTSWTLPSFSNTAAILSPAILDN